MPSSTRSVTAAQHRQFHQRIERRPPAAHRIADPDPGKPGGFDAAGIIGCAGQQPVMRPGAGAEPDHCAYFHEIPLSLGGVAASMQHLCSRCQPPSHQSAACNAGFVVSLPASRTCKPGRVKMDTIEVARRIADQRLVVAAAVAPAPQRLRREGPRGQPPVFRGSARHSAGRDLVRKEFQRRFAARGRVLPHLFRAWPMAARSPFSSSPTRRCTS